MFKSINKVIDGVQCGLDAVAVTGKGVALVVEGVTGAPAEVHRDVVGWTRGENQMLTDEQHESLQKAYEATKNAIGSAKNTALNTVKAPFTKRETTEIVETPENA